ncbi:NACHT domain-containing protein [Anabaena azotica]|uniref:NACHT domain-containing protein n=1 Tax=Anabaena azotica TaxID=197653 RepID=UPI0039A5A69E
MNKNTEIASDKQEKTLLIQIIKILCQTILLPIIIGFILLLIEYKSGLFQQFKGSPNDSISPLWAGIAGFTSVAFIISFVNYIKLSLNSRNYFREEFSFSAISTISCLIIGLLLSLFGQLMFWQPLIALVYILSNNKVTISYPSWEGYGFLILLIVSLYLITSKRYQNWDGLKSIQQHQREQKSEDSGMLLEGIQEFQRILNGNVTLEKYSELTPAQLLNPLEPSEDFISPAWEQQARELLRLSSSSYAIDPDGWHDKQRCWVGHNVDNGKLFFLYPVQSQLSKQELERFVDYSKEIAHYKNLQIDEIIVVFQENIHKSTSPTNLHKQYIRFETEQSLIENLVNFTDYRNDIRKRVLINKLPESDLVLDDVYVPSQLLMSKEDRANDNNVEDYLRKWLDEPSHRQIALLGEYGQGKSSAMLMLTYHLLCEVEELPKRIPILIELRGKSPRDLRPLELLGAWASQYRIEPQALMRLHIAGRLVLIFEGFDEMALIGTSEMRLRHFRSLWRFCYLNAKIIITGRPNFFLDDQEMKTSLGIVKPIADKPYCEAIRLSPFNIDQIQEALKKQKPLIREQICSLAKNETRFLELVSRPSLLHVVSVIWEKEKLDQKTALINSAYVMECFVRNSYRRQGLKAQDSREFMALNSSERDYYMCGIASYMAAEQLSNQISNEQLNHLVDDLTEVIPDSVSTSSPEIFDEDTRPLKLRIQDPIEDIEHIKTDVRTCGLLVDDSSSPGTFKFGHKSFMEYLVAVTVKEFIWNSDSEKAYAIIKLTSLPIEAILDLPVSVVFLAEMIGTDTATKQSINVANTRFKAERNIAIRLLKVIFNLRNNSVLWFILSLLIFIISHLKSLKKIKMPQRIFLLFTNPIIIFYFILMVSTIPIVSSRYFAGSYSNLDTFPVFMTSLFIFTQVMIMYFQLRNSPSILTSSILLKLRLWNSICKELQIDDKVLHQIARTSLLPWTKNHSFDYFLKKTD